VITGRLWFPSYGEEKERKKLWNYGEQESRAEEKPEAAPVNAEASTLISVRSLKGC
jgi:hypothetical protein